MAGPPPPAGGDLSLAQLQSRLYALLHADGTSAELRAHLRQRVLGSLRAQAAGPPHPAAAPPKALVHRAVNALVLEHLRHSGLSVSCDVFATEADYGHGFGVTEALEVLRIAPLGDGEEGSALPPIPICADTPLLHVITTLSNLVAATRKRCAEVFSKEVQCDLQTSCSAIEEKLRYIDATLRRQREGQAVAVDQAMRRYREELEGRMQDQLEVERQHFRVTELARMRREEAARYQQALARKLAKLRETEAQLQDREACLRRRERALETGAWRHAKRGEVAMAGVRDAAVQVVAAELWEGGQRSAVRDDLHWFAEQLYLSGTAPLVGGIRGHPHPILALKRPEQKVPLDDLPENEPHACPRPTAAPPSCVASSLAEEPPRAGPSGHTADRAVTPCLNPALLPSEEMEEMEEKGEGEATRCSVLCDLNGCDTRSLMQAMEGLPEEEWVSKAERTDPGAVVDHWDDALRRPPAPPAGPPRAPNHSSSGDAPHRAPAEPPGTEDQTVDQAVDPSAGVAESPLAKQPYSSAPILLTCGSLSDSEFEDLVEDNPEIPQEPTP
eukprot:EG_transcript_8407